MWAINVAGTTLVMQGGVNAGVVWGGVSTRRDLSAVCLPIRRMPLVCTWHPSIPFLVVAAVVAAVAVAEATGEISSTNRISRSTSTQQQQQITAQYLAKCSEIESELPILDRDFYFIFRRSRSRRVVTLSVADSRLLLLITIEISTTAAGNNPIPSQFSAEESRATTMSRTVIANSEDGLIYYCSAVLLCCLL